MKMNGVYLVRAEKLIGVEALIRSLGGNPLQLLQKVGLASEQLREPGNYISHQAVANFLTLCASTLSAPLFGLQLALLDDGSKLGALTLPITIQPSIRESITIMQANIYINNNANIFTLDEGKRQACLSWVTLDSGAKNYEQLHLCEVQRMANFIKIRHGGMGNKINIHLAMSAPDEIPDWAAHLLFNQKFNGLTFPIEYLDSTLTLDPRDLTSLVEETMSKLQLAYPSNLQSMIQHVISQLLPTGGCSLVQVALALDMSVRQLQARLKELGSSYSRELKACRLNSACSLLRQPEISITDIALRMGFSEQSVFSRQFKEWTGYSPNQWRKQEEINL